VPTDVSPKSLLDDRARLGRALIIAGSVGGVAALVVGIAGWLLAGRATRTLAETMDPLSGIVANVSETIDASLTMVDQVTVAIDSIESATRSTARTLSSVGQIVDDTAELVEGPIAGGLESAVDTLPALIDTGRVIDRTMRALSLVGVDYDPEVPLDESLGQLEDSLRPLPDQLRDQVELLTEVRGDVDQIALDAGALAGVLLETRIDLIEVRRVLESVSENVGAATVNIGEIRADIRTYDTLAKAVVIAVTVALLAAASAPLGVGGYLRRNPGRP
jgi:methyl-accepting chemotaxis protein